MSNQQTIAQTAPPKLPWKVTIVILGMVFLAGLVRPAAPHGFVQFLMQLVGWPISLDIGGDRSVRLVEESAIVTRCQPSDARWSPDGSIVVVECWNGLQAWTRDGRQIGSVAANNGWPQKHMQILADPFRVAYLAKAGDPNHNQSMVAIWDVMHDTQLTVPDQPTEIDNFVIDQERDWVAIFGASSPNRDIKLLSLDDGQLKQTLHAHLAISSLRKVPTADALLLGSYDGVLSRADIATNQVRELARPYRTNFPSGGGATGIVGGLALSRDNRSVAIFKIGGSVSPKPGSNLTDLDAEKKWSAELGTAVEIRSVEDGRLLDRMPGQNDGGIPSLAWDPHDRFIAIASRNAIVLWDKHKSAQAVISYRSGIVHTLVIADDGSRLALTTENGVRIFRIEEQTARR